MHTALACCGSQGTVVETLNTILLTLYGAAAEVSPAEFPAFAASLVNGLGASAQVAPHVQQAIGINRALNLAAPLPSSASAICRMDGALQFSAPSFTALLRMEWPDCESGMLPAELLAMLRPGAPLAYSGRRIVVNAKAAGELLMLAGRAQSPLANLSQRETQTVMLFGAGKSTKEIARVLDVTHNSVRNFVQRAYKKLGVSDKAELAVLIGGWPAPGV